MNDLPERDGPMPGPGDAHGSGFAQPWATRAFAIVVKMFKEKHYAWPEWVDYFSNEIKAPGHYKQPHPEDLEPLAGDARRIDENYSEMWLSAAEKLLADKGLVSKEELDARVAELAGAGTKEAGAAFSPGDRVRVREVEPVGSAHLSLDVLAKTGVVERDLGQFPFPGEGPQRMYSVRFTAREIRGPEAAERDSLYFSLWESYLDPA